MTTVKPVVRLQKEKTESMDVCKTCGRKVTDKKVVAPEGYKMNPAYFHAAKYEFDYLTKQYIELCNCGANNEIIA